MQAIVCQKYGGPEVLLAQTIPKPVPKSDQVLVKVGAASMNAGDWHIMRADPFPIRLVFGMFRPRCKVIGFDVAGTIEAVGKSVTDFKVGDQVYADTSNDNFGAFAEYVVVKEKFVSLKPNSLDFEEAATVPGASVTALQAIRDHGKMKPGYKVLVNGASGGVGSFSVQIAKAFGASEVTGVTSTRNIDLVRSIGADKVIDYTQEDFSKNGERYDLIVDAAGFAKKDFENNLTEQGTYVFIGGSYGQLGHMVWKGMIGSRKMMNMLVEPCRRDLLVMKELIEAGKVRPLIDRRYALRELPEAMAYLETGRARGKIIIKVQEI